MTKKSIVILGSTGSIGTNALQVVAEFADRFEVVGLSGGKNVSLMREQCLKFRPKIVAMGDDSAAGKLAGELRSSSIKVLGGPEGLAEVARLPEAELVLSAIVGASGLLPTLEAIKAGKRVALANKESLVMAGKLLTETAWKRGTELIPVDSEHSAIFQCIAGCDPEEVAKVYLTGSGGPLRELAEPELERVTPEAALSHPNWRMGPKISVDSATLMNKGLEVIEAMWLFDLELDQLEVVIHPQSVVHSMVEFVDGSIIAQMGVCDMKFPIQYAMLYPARLKNSFKKLNVFEMDNLSFSKPDFKRFPCLGLAIEAARRGSTVTTVMSAGNEVAVDAFLNRKIRFVDIPRVIREVMDRHTPADEPRLEEILQADAWARSQARNVIGEI